MSAGQLETFIATNVDRIVRQRHKRKCARACLKWLRATPPANTFILAKLVSEFVAPQFGEAPGGLLDGGDLLAGKALAEEGGRLQALNARVHGCRRASIPPRADPSAQVNPKQKKFWERRILLTTNDIQAH